MKFGFKNLEETVRYTVVDVDFVRKQGVLYELRVILHYKIEEEDFFVHRYSNVQFGRQLRINSSWKKDSVHRPDNTMIVDLPGWLCRAKSERIITNQFLSKEFLFEGRYDYIKGNEKHSYGQKAIKITPRYPYDINGKKVRFFIIPNYEIYRYFVFGLGVYNEMLLNGMSFEQNSSNELYNPTNSGLFLDDEGSGFKIIHLRPKIADTNAPIVGDLLFNKKIEELALFFVSGLNLNRYPFPCSGFPIDEAKSVRAYAHFVDSIKGETGLYISSFAEIKQDDLYFFGRDNDGRSTAARNDKMPKVFRGKRKKKAKRKNKERLNHNLAGDKDIEPASLNDAFDQFEYEDRSFDAIKLNKTTQDYIAEKKESGGEAIPGSKGVMSDNGRTGGGVQPVDNSAPLGEDDITDEKYWKRFPDIVYKMSSELSDLPHSIRFYSKELEFITDRTISNFINVPEVNQNLEFYLVQIEIGMSTFYIMEIDPTLYEVPTMVFWNEEAAGIFTSLQMKKLLMFYYAFAGVPKNIAKAVSEEYQPIEYRRIVHNYVKKTGGNERYSAKEAVDYQGKKLAALIRVKFV